MNEKEIMKVGEYLEKAFNLREWMTREDDLAAPRRFMEEPINEGPKKGWVREEHDKALDEYYGLRGWNKKTVISPRKKLEELAKHGILVKKNKRKISLSLAH